ncbi:beta-N-acetylhexosaminidase [Meinhardsimonia xiamenensis]|jgi:beta-N-acetylhexosaminidase|uniref:beta-N-acetylhexosaminidase n=1 Tax=Meinhardsimonia xiamenensis TaxID=990712 RepID=A0A1G9BLK2_9RHOB|nr:glycoside hydrolase family 3 N-terminal domain-containing protein [Meinhardsimonia xiamenensis]PRX34931.1 beta-N-acetylhexosaminidase [Meinhardsimonia xiamenensis]SDK40366.1 beta-N-acetylhexosaminidase [Meinhardsimonia xiamenensis]
MAGPGAFICGCAGPRLTASERAFFAESQPWGFILFSRNLETPDQIRALTAELRAAVGREAPVLIDQEGGRVARLGAPHWREWPPALDHAARLGPDRAARGLGLRALLIAAEIRACGIDVNCVPLADVALSDTHPVLRNRCYGETAEAVAERARAVAEGTLAGGALPVVKHVPGHGRARVDSHLEPPVVTAPLAELRASDFLPFARLAALPLGMTAHVVYTALDAARPATLSERVIGAIRGEIGFRGLLMSDDISMQALTGGVGARAAAARAAGCDLVLHCNGEMAEMEAVAAAAGALEGAALDRADAALAARPSPLPPEAVAEARAALAALEEER